MPDCAFKDGDNYFRYRAGGFIINDGRMLFARNNDMGYYYMIGGGVCMGEASEDCIEREIYEETGMRAEAVGLAVVCENFFRGKGGVIDGSDCHTVEMYYRMKLSDDEIVKCRKISDEGEELVWIPVKDIPASDIKPSFIRERIGEIIEGNGIIHVINETDR